MRTDHAVTIHRQDYRPFAYRVDSVALEFELDIERTTVTASLFLERNPDAEADDIRLDGDGLELVEVAVDDRVLAPREYSADARGLVIHLRPERCTLRTVVRIRPSANTMLSGLYASHGNLITQCEAEGFRRITWFPDRPDVMARYTVTLRADRERFPVLLSNGNLVASGSEGDAHWVRWEDPFPKPSYLFAIVAGRFEALEHGIETSSGRKALLQVWVEPGNLDKTGHAMQALERAIRWDEARFGLELDLDRFMIVATGDFNMGAMENKGLNVFNTRYVFANPRIATDADYMAIESVVGHEYFHNWTGNRVTCRDWFQLTLKEGLTVFRDQEFTADMLAADAGDPVAAASARAVKRIDDVRLLRTAQFAEDAGPMAHPIRPDAYQEINNFYTVTVYEKGAEVIRMLHTLVGRDGFRRGMDLYFARHDGQAVTCDDFIAAIADANHRDLTQFRRWYEQAGTPRISASGSYDPDTRSYTLTLRQWTPPTPGQHDKPPLHVPFALGLVGPDGRDMALVLEQEAGTAQAQAMAQAAQAAQGAQAAQEGAGASEGLPRHTRVLELRESTETFRFVDLPARPVPSLLRDFSAPVIVENDLDEDALAFLAAHDPDAFNRWEAFQRLAVAAVIGVLQGADPKRRARGLCEAFGRVLDEDRLDDAFRAQALTLPSEGYVAEQLTDVDPVALRAARDAVIRTVAEAHASRWAALAAAPATEGPYRPDPVSAGRRALRAAALAYWVRIGAHDAFAGAEAIFDGADNMSERFAAIHALANSPAPMREAVLARYAEQFADEPLAMDKWFALQASMRRQPGDAPVLARVRSLMAHPAFDIRNPNKARALIGSFCNGNLAEFHAADGSGYAFWVEQVLRLDPVNPQVAARLARALDRWRKFTVDRQALMRQALEQVAAAPSLSPDVDEIVAKALAS